MVGAEDLLEALGCRSGRVGRRERRRRRWYGAVADEPLNPRRCAEHQHARRVAVDPERVRHAGRDHPNASRLELEAVRAGPYGELPVEHDVALVLRVGV